MLYECWLVDYSYRCCFLGTVNLALGSCLHFKLLKKTLMIVLSFLKDVLKLHFQLAPPQVEWVGHGSKQWTSLHSQLLGSCVACWTQTLSFPAQ